MGATTMLDHGIRYGNIPNKSMITQTQILGSRFSRATLISILKNKGQDTILKDMPLSEMLAGE